MPGGGFYPFGLLLELFLGRFFILKVDIWLRGGFVTTYITYFVLNYYLTWVLHVFEVSKVGVERLEM